MKKNWNRTDPANWNLGRKLDGPPAGAFDFPDTDIPDDVERDPGADWPVEDPDADFTVALTIRAGGQVVRYWDAWTATP